MGEKREVAFKTVSALRVACSAKEFGSIGQMRHVILRPGAVDTLCGATASHPEIWRRNTTKPDCVICTSQARQRGLRL